MQKRRMNRWLYQISNEENGLSDRTSTYLFTTPVLILSCLRTAAVLLSDMTDVRKVVDGGTEVSTEGTEGKLERRKRRLRGISSFVW